MPWDELCEEYPDLRELREADALEAEYEELRALQEELDAEGCPSWSESGADDGEVSELHIPISTVIPHLREAVREELRELVQAVIQLRADLAELKFKVANPMPVSVSVEEAAARLGCGRTQVFKLLRQGKVRKGKQAGRSLRITVASIETFLSGPKRQEAPRRPHRYPAGDISGIRTLPIGAKRRALMEEQERASRGEGGGKGA